MIQERKDYPRYPQHPRAPYYYPGGDGDGKLPRRRVDRVNIKGIGLTGEASGLFNLKRIPAAAGTVLLDIRAYQELWFRLYANAEDRDADAARTIDLLPPTTPIILDCLFTDPSPTAAAPLDTEGWIAGPGCTNAGEFDLAFDGDDDTAWTAGDWYTGNGQSIGDTFSIDMGGLRSFQKIKMDTFEGSDAYPATFSIETSEDGAAWVMQEASVTGSSLVTVALDAAVTAQYIRLVIVTTRAAEWAIGSLVVYSPATLESRIRLFDGDVEGVLAFNWDNPATNKLYFRLRVLDPTIVGHLYQDSFAGYTRECTIRAFSTSDIGGHHIVWGVPETNVGNCDLLHLNQPQIFQHTAWTGAVYFDDDSGSRPRFFFDWYQLRCNEGFTSIGRFALPPDDRSITGFRTEIGRGSVTYDPTGFLFSFFAYLDSENQTPYSWDTKARLGMGIQRASASAVIASIGWWNEANVFAELDSLGGVAFPTDSVLVLSGDIAPEGENVRATLYADGVEVCSALVPQALLDLPRHNHVGISMTVSGVPDAPAAEPAFGLNDLMIYGADNGINIDIGHVPIERPGGVLASPTALE